MYIDYYRKDIAKPIIIEILGMEGYDITEDCIKSWSRPKMNYTDVLLGIGFVKSIGKGTIVFTNEVYAKDKIGIENDITILDISDLYELATKHRKYKLIDLITD